MALHSSVDVSVPVVLGIRRPVILLPKDFAETDIKSSKDGSIRDAILIHELAHIVRGDFVWQLLLRGLKIMLWFNPLFWLAERRINYARERVCDEFAVHGLGDADRYVETVGY